MPLMQAVADGAFRRAQDRVAFRRSAGIGWTKLSTAASVAKTSLQPTRLADRLPHESRKSRAVPWPVSGPRWALGGIEGRGIDLNLRAVEQLCRTRFGSEAPGSHSSVANDRLGSDVSDCLQETIDFRLGIVIVRRRAHHGREASRESINKCTRRRRYRYVDALVCQVRHDVL